LISLALSIPARALYAQLTQEQLTLLATLFTSLTLVVLAIWLTLHRLMNRNLDELLQISLHHRHEESIKLEHNYLVPNKLANLINSFTHMSEEINKREAELLHSNEFSSTILNNISDAVSIIDPQTYSIIAANPAFLQLYNLRLSEVIGRKCQSVCNCQHLNPKNHDLCPGEKAVESGLFTREQRSCQSTDKQIICEVNATPIIDHNGRVTQIISVAHNITESIHQQQQIHHMAYHDGLTGLPNRELFKDRLEQALLQSTRNNGSGVIALVDLDKFKEVNDTYGHASGDELLKITAERLTQSVRSTDTVARMSGDEFLVIFREVSTDEQAIALAQQLLNALTRPIPLTTGDVTIAASVGLCCFPKHGTSVDELLKCADSAMYSAKKCGHNTVHLTS
jgi:diguanylate cyclase (GGDEF)-like protein/PAS domain S-box-containing protein